MIMKRKSIPFFLVILYIVSLFVGFQQVYAQDSTKKAESPTGFNYKVIQPKNQRNTKVGYFDLRMKPEQKQTVQIELSNASAAEIEVEVLINGAKTNGNGVIEYGPTGIKNDASLKYAFEDLVKAPEKVKVPATGNAMVDIEITMPAVSYDGLISGGIQLKNAQDEKERAKKKGVINEYAFLVGMLLTETDTVVEPDLKLNKVFAGLSNYRNNIFVNFSNIQAAYLENVTVDVQITKKDSENVLYEAKKAGMRIAPNSMVDFPISMNGEKMSPGDYKAHIAINAADNKKWVWEEEFTITDEDADKYNKQDVDLIQEKGIDWKIIAIIVAGVFIVVVTIFVIVRIVNNKKRARNKKRNKSKDKKNV